MSDLLYGLGLLWVALSTAVALILGFAFLYFEWEQRKMMKNQRQRAEQRRDLA